MRVLPKSTLENSKRFIWTHCEALTQALFTHYLEKENKAGILASLSHFQNSDGGFGYNLEGDFELPDSSPIATSVAFQILSALNAKPDEPIVQKGIQYLINSYNPNRKGWISVPPQVNDFPHADWWHYDEAKGGSIIDRNWGNPTAELVGCLYHYRAMVSRELWAPLYKYTLDYLRNFSTAMEMHELFCFLRFAKKIPPADFNTVKEKLIDLVMNVVTTDPEAWKFYSAQPLDFVHKPDSFLCEPLRNDVEKNLDFWLETIQPDGTWIPAWTWDHYPQAWEKARIQIVGRMTVARLNILNQFNRIDL
jgi:hypothetical protein